VKSSSIVVKRTDAMRNMPRPRDDAAGFTIHRERSLDADATNPELTINATDLKNA